MNIRPPAVAGMFYPADPEHLRTTVAALLADASTPAAAPPPKALIAPHAGYVYSGAVAAAAFATLRAAHGIERVVVIGPAHYVPVAGVAVPTADAFDTPLGRVPVDRQALAAIADLPSVGRSDAAHAPEHALSVVAGESAVWYQGKRGFLPPVAIAPAVMLDERGAQV